MKKYRTIDNAIITASDGLELQGTDHIEIPYEAPEPPAFLRDMVKTTATERRNLRERKNK